jgi:RNase H-fold protein (predicted Holliday junction resolvase)
MSAVYSGIQNSNFVEAQFKKYIKCEWHACNLVFNNEIDCYNHGIEDHIKTQKTGSPAECLFDNCEYKRKTKNYIQSHYSKHFRFRLNSCLFCPAKNKKFQGMERHMRKTHSEKPRKYFSTFDLRTKKYYIDGKEKSKEEVEKIAKHYNNKNIIITEKDVMKNEMNQKYDTIKKIQNQIQDIERNVVKIQDEKNDVQKQIDILSEKKKTFEKKIEKNQQVVYDLNENIKMENEFFKNFNLI